MEFVPAVLFICVTAPCVRKSPNFWRGFCLLCASEPSFLVSGPKIEEVLVALTAVNLCEESSQEEALAHEFFHSCGLLI